MNRKLFLLGMVSIILTFGMVLVGCATSFTVTFDAGVTAPGAVTVASGDTVGSLPIPEKAGFVFGGWYTDNDSFEDEFTAETIVTGNITVYARWQVIIRSEHVGTLVLIKAGTFTMGTPKDEPNRSVLDETPHEVTLTKGFYMGEYEITQAQYLAVMGSNPSWFQEENGYFPADWGEVPTSPNADWDAIEMVSNATGYRLPTEAEWEYACRAGTENAYNTGTDTWSDDIGWSGNNSNDMTHEVGKKAANAWGLYDMHGNVCEWCWDWYGEYPDAAADDYAGASVVSFRILRGGSMSHDAESQRSAFRGGYEPYDLIGFIGFRDRKSVV
jgi:uncharacterized repeat protein (TIGR02543 family)